MTPETLRRILDKIEYQDRFLVQQITFNWRGEPLMNKQYIELLRVFEGRRYIYDLQFHTNATLLTEKTVKSLLSIKVPYTVYLSIDGGSAASHDLHRGLGTFKKAMRGARELLSQRGERKNPTVGLYQLDLLECEENYDPEFISLKSEVDLYQRVRPVLPDGDEEVFRTQSTTVGGSSLVKEWERKSFVKKIPQGPCFWAGNSLNITPMGDVYICILSHTTDGLLGNILMDDVEEIVERASNFRRLLENEGRSSVPHCRSCSKGVGAINTFSK
ncbi:MAG: SPASM domain-containing protein [Spirosomataceae bacterium]